MATAENELMHPLSVCTTEVHAPHPVHYTAGMGSPDKGGVPGMWLAL